MARTNLSLGNLYRATVGSERTTQASSLNARNASAGTAASMLAFAVDSITINQPTFTYIVESTSENATFSFGSAGSLHGTRVGSVAANYSVTFDNANFSVGSPTLGVSPSFPITPAAINASNYSEASSILSMKYADGYNTAATNYNTTTTKTLYAVDVYNTINQPDFCLLFGTKVTLANGNEVNIEDLNVGDEIKAWEPTGLPDESQPLDSDQVEWRFYLSNTLSGDAKNVVVRDITFNFAEGYFSLNNGLINATETHPLYVYDNDLGKYKFKNVGEILPGDKLIMQDESEIEITNIEVVTADVEIVTLNVENADVFLSNGLISHNKGTTTQPYIPSSGLRMYVDPGKASSTDGTATADWLDLSGYNTGVRPAGVTNAASITGGNPSYNNGASKKEKYWTGNGTNQFWYKDLQQH
jgi:signal peptidase I